MPKISDQSNYGPDANITGEEYLIGTDADGSTATYSIDAIKSYIENNFSGEESAASIKTKYESNPDTNGVTNIEKARISVDLQPLLVSATNIKTVNGNSLLGAGDITISASSLATDDQVITDGEIRIIKLGSGGSSIQIDDSSDNVIVGIGPTGLLTSIAPTVGNNLTNKTYVDGEVSSRQEPLVSGTNIKTVNGNSLLGSGDVVISGGSGDLWSDVVDSNIIPDADNTRTLGSLTERFQNIFTNGIRVFGGTIEIDTIASNTGGGIEGTIIANSTINRLEYYDGTSWKAVLLEGDVSGGITAENQRKINNSRDFLILNESVNRNIALSDIISSTANDENKKPILTVSGTDDVDFTVPTGLGAIGQSFIIDNDGTGEVNVIPDTGVTLIGINLGGVNDSVKMDGAVSGQEFGRVVLTQKVLDTWRVDGVYIAYPDLLPHPNDNNANPDLVTGISLGFGSDNANVDPVQTGGAPFNSTITTVQDSSNGYVEYITEVTATATTFSRGQSTFTLESGETYNYFIYYETPNGATDMRIRSNSGFVTEFNHEGLTGSGTLSGTVVADATSAPIEYWANKDSGLVGDKARFLISFEKQ